MPFLRLSVSTIGRVAREVLQGSPVDAIAGVTSRGVFVRLGECWIVFLSVEAHHGPLTLNLSSDAAPLMKLVVGEPAMMTDDEIVFPAHEIKLTIGDALVWQAPSPPGGIVSSGRVQANLRATVEEITAQEDPANLPGLLDDLRRLLARTPEGGETERPFLTALERLSRALVDGQPAAASAALAKCLGRGSGLTPSGDDLSLGFLLALGRWGRALKVGMDIEAVRAGVLEAAYRQTTTLSANLLECAAAGQADERLITALDGIVTGAPDAAVRAAQLRSWGSSSGIDALAGMASVLLAVSTNA